MAIDKKIAVQEVDTAALKAKLLDQGAVMQ
jgi:hypothetical protein